MCGVTGCVGRPPSINGSMAISCTLIGVARCGRSLPGSWLKLVRVCGRMMANLSSSCDTGVLRGGCACAYGEAAREVPKQRKRRGGAASLCARGLSMSPLQLCNDVQCASHQRPPNNVHLESSTYWTPSRHPLRFRSKTPSDSNITAGRYRWTRRGAGLVEEVAAQWSIDAHVSHDRVGDR